MNNQFQPGPFGGRNPILPGPGRAVPVVNGGMPAKPMGQVPAAQGFIPMNAAPQPAPQPPAQAQAPAPAPAPQKPGSIPIGSKGDCPVCRPSPFGKR